MSVYTHICTDMDACACTCVRTCTHVCNVGTCVCAYMRAYTCIYIHTPVCVYKTPHLTINEYRENTSDNCILEVERAQELVVKGSRRLPRQSW